MKTIKYSTKHLECVRAFSQKGQEHYQIFEKENGEKPVAIYVNSKTKMHLSDDFPKPENKYKYFNEMCEIIQHLYVEEQGLEM